MVRKLLLPRTGKVQLGTSHSREKGILPHPDWTGTANASFSISTTQKRWIVKNCYYRWKRRNSPSRPYFILPCAAKAEALAPMGLIMNVIHGQTGVMHSICLNE